MKILQELSIVNIIPLLLGMVVVNDSLIRISIFWGWIVVLISVSAGIISYKISRNKENKRFLKIYFGGMVARLLLLLMVIFLILKYISINQISFLFSLFIFYIINQIVELRFITKSSDKK